jgi:hypothetical protein
MVGVEASQLVGEGKGKNGEYQARGGSGEEEEIVE